MDSLKERLDKRVGAVVPILNLKRKRFTWVRVAAAIIIIVGVGLLVQQLVFNDRNKNSIASLEKKEKNPESVANNNQIKPDSINKDVPTQSGSVANKQEQKTSISPNAGSYVHSNLDTTRKTDRANAEYKKREVEKYPQADCTSNCKCRKKR